MPPGHASDRSTYPFALFTDCANELCRKEIILSVIYNKGGKTIGSDKLISIKGECADYNFTHSQETKSHVKLLSSTASKNKKKGENL